ncbi:hypothetical protein IJ425_01945 [bacterium]|nr:hypothetical protein [bacterium]
MTRHAFNRINERYGNRFTWADIKTLRTLINKGLYLEIVNNFAPKNKKTILLKYKT